MVSVVAAVWFPLAAVLTPAHVADSDPAPDLLGEVPAEVRFVLGGRHYNVPELRSLCDQQDRLLVTTRYGRYPHSDALPRCRLSQIQKLCKLTLATKKRRFGRMGCSSRPPREPSLLTQRACARLGGVPIQDVYLLMHTKVILEGLRESEAPI